MLVAAQLDALVETLRDGLSALDVSDVGVGNVLWGPPIDPADLPQLDPGKLLYLSKKGSTPDGEWSQGGSLKRTWSLSVVIRLWLGLDSFDRLEAAGRSMERMEKLVLKLLHIGYDASLFAEPLKFTGGSAQTRIKDGQYQTFSELSFDVVCLTDFADLKDASV